MTLFEELGIEYREENGLYYPVLSVETEGVRPDETGKYGRMWLKYMKENQFPRYRHLMRLGRLSETALRVNEEAYERLDCIEGEWLKSHLPAAGGSFVQQLHIRNQARMMAEEMVLDEVVLKSR
jgi:hypothetical protein